MAAECVFCMIVDKRLPAKVVGENERALAFLDVRPCSDGHTLVIPKRHTPDFSSCPEEDLADVAKLTKQVALKIKRSRLDPLGINYLSNEGSVARQEVFHLHVHVIPKYAKGEGFFFDADKKAARDTDAVLKDLNEERED